MTHASLRRSLGTAVAAAAASALLLVPASASGATLLSAPLKGVQDSVDRTCTAKPLGDVAGVVTRKLTAPSLGMVNARLSGGRGDWDLAVFDAATGDVVAGSSHAGSREVASGFVTAGQALVVQACAREGAGGVPSLAVGLEALDAADAATPSLVRVIVPDDVRMRQLQELGLDLTEHGGPNFVEVVLHGTDDAATLKRAGFQYTVEVEDLGAQSVRHREQDRAYSAAVESSGLPSGRTTYRRLFDYGEDMKRLAEEHPGLVRQITLPNVTYEGRPVEGLVISEDVGASDGKPVFLQMGGHHAREWPSSEHAMEWAFELVEGYKKDQRVTDLMGATRTVVVPVVNPDGFNISREAGVLGGREGPEELVNMVAAVPGEYRRKNCRFVNDAEGGSCLQPSLGLLEPGVDPNRNYPGFWGGPGASDMPLSQAYRGPGPSSEPEVSNVRDLISQRHVTTLITNHTFSNLVLRPPGVQSQGATPDEKIYKALGDAMAAENGYASQHGYELYDTTGTTEDWSYYATGGLGYTFEIGPSHFHPPYEDMVAEYEGETEAADDEGDGNREAYFLAQKAAADPAKHSVLTGRAPGGATLRLTKTFTTPSSQEGVSVQDTLETTLEVPRDGAFEWHINPSTRPLVAQERGRPATGEPSAPQGFSGAPGLQEARPCADYETTDPACWRDHAFTVPDEQGVDNASVTVRIAWPTPVSDWDLKVFLDANNDKSSVGETEPVASSAQGATDSEEATFTEPLLKPGGKYVARVINWAAFEPYEGTVTFAGPEPFQPAQTEAWTLTCERGGEVVTRQEVVIDRGETQRLNLGRCSAGGQGR